MVEVYGGDGVYDGGGGLERWWGFGDDWVSTVVGFWWWCGSVEEGFQLWRM